MPFPKIDLHMHSCVSDGSDTPELLLARVKEAGIGLFSLTDHDAVKGCLLLRELWREGDPHFLCGAEFSCRDEQGQYHILGYGYDPQSEAMRSLVALGHSLRMTKVLARLDFLKSEFGIEFAQQELDELLALDNPGKPHIAKLLIRHGYASSIKEALKNYVDRIHFGSEYVRPEQAVEGILRGGGVPVLAHPAYGSGDQLILGEDMDRRLRRLMDFGLRGVEAFYSGFTEKLRAETLRFAERYGLYVTAGSDYHGSNKLIALGDTGLSPDAEWPDGLRRFLDEVRYER